MPGKTSQSIFARIKKNGYWARAPAHLKSLEFLAEQVPKNVRKKTEFLCLTPDDLAGIALLEDASDSETSGHRIRVARQIKGLQQNILARQCRISAVRLNRIERGNANIQGEILRRIAEQLNVHEDWISGTGGLTRSALALPPVTPVWLMPWVPYFTMPSTLNLAELLENEKRLIRGLKMTRELIAVATKKQG